jgi:glycosyltransferase involved in cell wall biosynthesis
VWVAVKILLVHNEYKFLGGEDVVVRQEKSLLENNGQEVLTYFHNNRELEQYSAFQRLTMVPRSIWAWDSKKQISEILEAAKPDVVHVHNTLTIISPSVYWACHEAGVPVVQTLHNFRLFCPVGNYLRDGKICEECRTHSLWRGVKYRCYRDSRAATATVALTLEVHRRLGTYQDKIQAYIAFHEFARQKYVQGGLPGEKIFLKPNFVPSDPGMGGGNGKFALFVGRLSPEKGIRTMLSAWERLKGAVPLVIAGDGPMRPLVEETAARVPGIEYRGSLTRPEVIQAMQEARFLLLPSECYEGFPMTIAEAFACGLPVVASRIGAMEVLIEDGRSGLHFSPSDPADCAAKALEAWGQPALLRRMGGDARQKYLDCYTAERNFTTLMDIYRRAIDLHK